MKTNLDPQAVIKNAGQSTLLIQSSTQDANVRILQKHFPSDKKNFVNKTVVESSSLSIIEKVEKMLSDLKIEQSRISKTTISQQFSDSDPIDFSCKNSKDCNVLTKFEEQEVVTSVVTSERFFKQKFKLLLAQNCSMRLVTSRKILLI